MKTIETRLVKTSECFITPLQSRDEYDAEDIASLAATFESTGQLQNAIGRIAPDGRIEIFVGCRRFLAAEQSSGELEVKIVEADDKDVLKANLIENTKRVGLSPGERARAIKRNLDLREGGIAVYSQAELAEKLGMTPNDITDHLAFLNAPESWQRKANKGEVQPSVVMILGSLPPGMQDGAADVFFPNWRKHMTKNDAERWVADNARKDLRKGSFDRKDGTLVKGKPACEACDHWGGNHNELTGKGKYNMCFDPTCFKAKQDASAAVLRRHAENSTTMKVLPEAEAAKIFDRSSGALLYSAPYVEVSGRPTEAMLKNPNSEPPKWEEILKESAAPIVWAIDGDGKHRKLVDLPKALEAARMQGNPHRALFKEVSAAKITGKEDESLERKKTIEGNKAEAACVIDAAGALLECLSVPWSRPMQLAFLKSEYESFAKDDFEFLCRVLRPDLKKVVDGRATLEELVSSMERPEQLWGLIGLCKWARSLRVSPSSTLVPYSQGPLVELYEAAEFDGADWKTKVQAARAAAEKQATAEFREKLKAEQKKEKKSAAKEKSVERPADKPEQAKTSGEMPPLEDVNALLVSQGNVTLTSEQMAIAFHNGYHPFIDDWRGKMAEVKAAQTSSEPKPKGKRDTTAHDLAKETYMATGSIAEASEKSGAKLDTVKKWHFREKWKAEREKQEAS